MSFPFIAYSLIAAAKIFKENHDADIALSTDSDEIKRVAGNYGLSTSYQRPYDLATDKAGKIAAIKDLILFEEKLSLKSYDYIIDLDVTSPLRTFKDIKDALNILKKSEKAYNIFSVSPASRNPYFNMVELGSDGFVNLVKDGTIFKTRQEAPVVYDMNASFYIYKRCFFNGLFETAITNCSLVYVVPHICFDLDQPHDFLIMEALIKGNLLDFQL